MEDNQYLRLYVYHNNCNQNIYYKNVLREFNIDKFRFKPHERTCASFQFMYKPAGNDITGDLNTINNTSLRDVFTKGPIYREPNSINRKHNIYLFKDPVRNYARHWDKREEDDTGVLYK